MAAFNGHVNALRFLLGPGQALFGALVKNPSPADIKHCAVDDETSRFFAVGRDMDSGGVLTLLDRAAYGGSGKLLEWLHAPPHSYAVTNFTMEEAFRSTGDGLRVLE
jgi:hypothetical protein